MEMIPVMRRGIQKVLILRGGEIGYMEKKGFDYVERVLRETTTVRNGEEVPATEVKVLWMMENLEEILKTEGADVVVFNSDMEEEAKRIKAENPGVKVVIFDVNSPKDDVIRVSSGWGIGNRDEGYIRHMTLHW